MVSIDQIGGSLSENDWNFFVPIYDNSYNQSKALDNILRNIHRSGFGSKLLRKPIEIRLFLSRNYINNTDEIFGYMIKHDAKIEF